MTHFQMLALKKLIKKGGVCRFDEFNRFEQARLRKIEKNRGWVRVTRFSTTSPMAIEVTAKGWVEIDPTIRTFVSHEVQGP